MDDGSKWMEPGNAQVEMEERVDVNLLCPFQPD